MLRQFDLDKGPAMITVDECREMYVWAMKEFGSHDSAINFAAMEAYQAAGGRASRVPHDFFKTCRAAFAEKLSRENNMEAAFVKMIWVAYQAGCPK